MNIDSDRKLNKELRKIKRYQRTKSIVLNAQIDTLINSLNKFNNEYSILISKFENKIKVNNTSYINSLIDLETVDKTQKVFIDQMSKLNNMLNLTNDYIENFQTIIDSDMKSFINRNTQSDTTQLGNETENDIEIENTFKEKTLQLSMMFIANLINDINCEIPFDR
jgi:hypothetical protein